MDSSQQIQRVVQKAKSILLEPMKYFSSLKKERGVKDAFVYYAVTALVGVVLGLIASRLFQGTSKILLDTIFGFDFPIVEYSLMQMVLMGAAGYLFALGLSFVWALIIHAYCVILGGKGSYEKSYQLVVYSATPKMLLSWIPFVGIVVWVYSIILLIFGTQELHAISRKRAILMYVIPAAIMLALIVLAISLLIAIVNLNPQLFDMMRQAELATKP